MGAEYKMFMGKDTKDYFDAMLKAQYQPSEENTRKLDEIHEKVTIELTKSQLKKELEFVSLYGQHLLDFTKSISKPYYLATINSPFSLSWDIKTDYENDNYWEVVFRKGQFHYQLSISGGYGGHETLETNISADRVLELINSNQPLQP